MEHLKIERFGPLGSIDLKFGDLTILVGAQASGKSMSLELLKLLVDRDHIINTLDRYNYIFGHSPKKILDMYFGDGIADVWGDDSLVMLDGQEYPKSWIPIKAGSKSETLFYIPAQRILSIADGRPKNFMEFDNTSPYVLRAFSETLRLFMQNGIPSDTLFPLKNRLKEGLKASLNESIFHNGQVVMEESTGQKKMRLKVGQMSLPFMTWSAGQKEFMPLLLGFYCLSGPPSKVVKREKYQYAVIEEPEMGLHPNAIISVLLQIVELMQSGIKVIVSTHSPVLLEFAWAFNLLKHNNVPQRKKALYEIFGVQGSNPVKTMMADLFETKSIRTYFFKHNTEGRVMSQDISTLDASDEDQSISEWGGISGFSSRVTDVVSKYLV